MERPKGTIEQQERTVTGEIVYLDEMWQQGQRPGAYEDLSDMALQTYEAEAALYNFQGVRPAILNLYKSYDRELSPLEASCKALLEELHSLKEDDSPLTFVDIVVKQDAASVLNRLEDLAAGSVLASPDEQLAFEPNDYYGTLDMRKRDAMLRGVGVRVWKWNENKYQLIDRPTEENPHGRVLYYPKTERSQWGQIDLSFSYEHPTSGGLIETVSLNIHSDGTLSCGRSVWMSAYAETGYEEHGHEIIELDEAGVAAFADLMAEVVGDEPMSMNQFIDREIRTIHDEAATEAGQAAVIRLVEAFWPAQAHYYLQRVSDEASIAELLRDEATARQAIARIDALIKERL